jgi:SAM-dependent methyltransferase
MDCFSSDWMIGYATNAVVVVLGIFLFAAISMFVSRRWGAPWVISDDITIDKMLALAKLKEGDTVVDLGAGDGRILIRAAQNYGVRGLGIEIDPIRVLLSRFFIRRRGLSKNIRIKWGDIFSKDFSEADAIVMYMTRESNARLRPIFETQLKPGTRVVCNAFPVPGWVPAQIDNINLIFVYQVGQTGDDVITEFV